ncbi:MAG: hypothetical protein EOO38_12890 [Cytophagaceae bacterium]|nr:MAG: hypothetical protein EOO38_12890 [Cytophagaceae bacterium]
MTEAPWHSSVIERGNHAETPNRDAAIVGIAREKDTQFTTPASLGRDVSYLLPCWPQECWEDDLKTLIGQDLQLLFRAHSNGEIDDQEFTSQKMALLAWSRCQFSLTTPKRLRYRHRKHQSSV